MSERVNTYGSCPGCGGDIDEHSERALRSREIRQENRIEQLERQLAEAHRIGDTLEVEAKRATYDHHPGPRRYVDEARAAWRSYRGVVT